MWSGTLKKVCNVVKQVQPDRKGSSATAHRLVTLWPSHHRAGRAVGGNVQIALLSFSSFSPPISSSCLCCAVCLLLTCTYAGIASRLRRELRFTYNDRIICWWPPRIDILTLVKTELLRSQLKGPVYRYCCGRVGRILQLCDSGFLHGVISKIFVCFSGYTK